jgi:hypothetical protein
MAVSRNQPGHIDRVESEHLTQLCFFSHCFHNSSVSSSGVKPLNLPECDSRDQSKLVSSEAGQALRLTERE